MTKEQGEALIKYIDAAIDANDTAHGVVHHGAPVDVLPPAEEARKAALAAFVALLP